MKCLWQVIVIARCTTSKATCARPHEPPFLHFGSLLNFSNCKIKTDPKLVMKTANTKCKNAALYNMLLINSVTAKIIKAILLSSKVLCLWITPSVITSAHVLLTQNITVIVCTDCIFYIYCQLISANHLYIQNALSPSCITCLWCFDIITDHSSGPGRAVRQLCVCVLTITFELNDL